MSELPRRVVVIGNVCTDIFLDDLHGWPGPGQRASQFSKSQSVVGGNGANVAYGLAVLGCKPTLLAAIGTDSIGGEITKRLASAGVKLGLAPFQGKTGVSYVIRLPVSDETDDEKRLEEPSYLHIAGVNSDLSPGAMRPLIEQGVFDDVQVVHLCGIGMLPRLEDEEMAAMLLALRERSDESRPIMITMDVNLDASPRPWHKRLQVLCRHVDVLMPNLDEAKQLLGTDLQDARPEDYAYGLLKRYETLQAVAVKCGVEGSVIAWKTESGRLSAKEPARSVTEAVDLTGAGDAWCAGCVAELAQQVAPNVVLDWDRMIIAGSETAARCVQVRGGTGWK